MHSECVQAFNFIASLRKYSTAFSVYHWPMYSFTWKFSILIFLFRSYKCLTSCSWSSCISSQLLTASLDLLVIICHFLNHLLHLVKFEPMGFHFLFDSINLISVLLQKSCNILAFLQKLPHIIQKCCWCAPGAFLGPNSTLFSMLPVEQNKTICWLLNNAVL